MSTRQLIVQADDFGMCHAINQGVAQSFEFGIVTQSSVMAPCPWVWEAAALALERGIPVGVHGTLTCEWDFLRWRPLTLGASLTEPDGTMYRTLEDAIAKIEATEAADELCAQVEYLKAFDLDPAYLDCHMGPATSDGISEACRRSQLPFLFPFVHPCLKLESIAMLSPMPAEEKKPWLLERLDGLEPGVHLILTHPAVADAELRAISRPDAENYCWAEENRTSDLAVLLDPEVAARVEELEIDLVSAADL